MRQDHGYILECLLWFSCAIFSSIILNIYRYRLLERQKTLHFSRQQIATSVIPNELLKIWKGRYSPAQMRFLIRASYIRCDKHAYFLEDHLLDDTWKLEGLDFVDSVLLWLFEFDVFPLLTALEALIVVAGCESIPHQVVVFAIRYVFLHGRPMDSMYKVAFSSCVQRLQEQLEMVGLLKQQQRSKQYLNSDRFYRLSTLVQKRKIRCLDWHEGFILALRTMHPVYATKHTIRLQLKCRLYQQARLTLEDHEFCFLRTQILGREKAIFQHIKDCCRIQHAFSKAMLPKFNMERSIKVMADIAKDPIACFLLGQFACHHYLPITGSLLHSTIHMIENEIMSELQLLSASFDRISIIYICYGQKDQYEEYKVISNLLHSKGDMLLSLFQAIKVHTFSEDLHTVKSEGFRRQLEGVKNRLLGLRMKFLPILHDSYLLIGNLERTSLIAQIIHSIHFKSFSKVQCKRWLDLFNCNNNRVSLSGGV
jgi:hypothetical protein